MKNVYYNILKRDNYFLFFSILIIIVAILLTIYNILNLKQTFEIQAKQYEKTYLETQKTIIKHDIDNIITHLIDQSIQSNIPKEMIMEKLSHIRFKDNRYIFLFEYKKGNGFMTPLVNPNIPSWVGKDLDLEKIKDLKGNKFMKDVLLSMQDKKDAFFLYYYKEPNSDKESKKLSYIKKYDKFNWYVGTGVHLNEIELYLNKQLQEYNQKYTRTIIYSSLFAMLAILIFAAFLFIYNRKFFDLKYELTQLQSLLDNVKKNAKVWYWIYDKENYQFIGEEKLKNISPQFSSIRDLFAVVVKNDYKDVADFFENSLANHQEDSIEFRIMIDGKIRYFEYSTKKIYNNFTGETDLMGIFNDRSEQRSIELTMLRKKILSTSQRMEQDSQKMVKMISHQWRHPIAHINAKLIDIYLDELDKEKFIEDIENSTEFMSNTINDFIDIMSDTNEKKSFLLKDAVEKIVTIFSPELLDIDIRIDIESKLEVFGSKSKFSQVFLNIINNTLEAFKEKNIQEKKISCHTTVDEDNVKLVFRDNAGGIDKDYIDKVFDLYYSTKKNKENKGLGMYIMKVIVEEHLSGKISLQNFNDGLETVIEFKR